MEYDRLEKMILGRLRDELPNVLTYHSADHTIEVNEAVEFLAHHIGCLADDEVTLLKTAAVMHDTGFLMIYPNNEEKACEYSRQLLPDYGYSSGQIEHICKMVMATALPQNPQDRFAEILCDADLSYLGTERYEANARMLRDELSARSHTFSEEEWLRMQVHFLETHEYFTNVARETWGPVKEKHLEKMKKCHSGIHKIEE